jgi:hypothetical protein
MSWLPPALRTSLMALLQGKSQPIEPPGDTTTLAQSDLIRELMLDALGADADRSHGPLCFRIRYADEVQDLWYLRSEWLQAVSAAQGEKRAREWLQEMNHLFVGFVPEGFTASRPAPLR